MADNNTIKEFEPIQKSEDTQIIIAIKEFKNKQYVDVRQWWKPDDKWLPTKNGVTVPVDDNLDLLEDFGEQISNALDYLREH